MDLGTFLQKVQASAQHKRFYHFTDKKNLDSIRKHGVLCTAELRRQGIFKAVTPGGDANSQASDRASGTDQFVCLCFTSNHPMCHIAQNDERKLDPVYLQIDPEIIRDAGVMITNAPSNQNGVQKIAAATALDNLDLDVIYNWMQWNDPPILARLKVAEKYEILVPQQVALKYLVGGL
jgi:hypothetical protein